MLVNTRRRGSRPSLGHLAAIAAVALLAGACSAAASPAASPKASAIATGPGTYTSSRFTPAVTVTLPAGWEVGEDSPTYMLVRPVGSTVLGIHLFKDPLAASQDPSCPAKAQAGVGTTSVALSTWMRSLPGLAVTSTELTTIGGLRGVVHDLGIVGTWTASCPFADGVPTVPLIVHASGYQWVMAGGERLRIYLLDVPSGGTVAVDIDDFEGSSFDAFVKDALPIVQSLSFATG